MLRCTWLCWKLVQPRLTILRKLIQLFSSAGTMPASATVGAIHARNSKVGVPRGSSLVLVSLFVAAVSMAVVSLHALTPEKLISQFTHTAWSAQDGIPAPVRAIAQTPDGYLWLGTEAGLYRFDGLHFLAWELASGEHLLSDAVLSLYVAKDGRLWIGYGSRGIGVLAGNRLQNFIAGRGVPDGGFYPSWKIGTAPFGPAGHTVSASMRTGYGIRLARRWAIPLLRLSRCS